MSKESQKELEQRRLCGGRLLSKGFTQAQVARELEVSATTVSRWAQLLAAGGLKALKPQRPRGRQAGKDFRPARRTGHQAMERKALARAKENARKRGQTIVFIVESGPSERPIRVRTWSPLGRNPDPAIQLQLEAAFGYRRNHLGAALLPILPRCDPQPSDCRVPQGAASSHSWPDAHRVEWTARSQEPAGP